MKPELYIYLPVFNEEETVGIFLYRLGEIMRDYKMDYQVYLTLDGCTDDSAEVVQPYLERMPIHVTDNDQRVGYGKSLFAAIKLILNKSRNPKRDFLLILDADFSLDPSVLNELADQIERNVDLYCYDRFNGKENNGRLGRLKKLAHKLSHPLLSFRGLKLKEKADLFSTTKGFRVQLLKRNFSRLKLFDALEENATPASCLMLLYLTLIKDARKLLQFNSRVKNMSRRSSRFSLLPNRLFILFHAKTAQAAPAQASPPPGDGRRPRQYSTKRNSTRRNLNNRRKYSSNSTTRPAGSTSSAPSTAARSGGRSGGEQEKQGH